MQNEIFYLVKDPRDPGNVKHALENVLRIALLGTVCACDDYEEIHDFVCERHEELRDMGFLKLANGIPSKYTIERVVEAVDPVQLKACLEACRINIVGSLSGKHVAFDGKKLRGRVQGAADVTVYIYRMHGCLKTKFAWPRNVWMTRQMN